MPKLSISDAAEQLGVSREAIHNRIRRGSLQSVVENGVKLVIVDDEKSAQTVSRKMDNKKLPNQTDERYYKFLEEQNVKLQQKVETLEGETRTLRDQKERMLIEERIKIEKIYKEKDEQLKNIINAISSKFMLNSTKNDTQDELFEAEIEEKTDEESLENRRLISLNKYLKSGDFSKKKISKIKEKFQEKAKDDSRIITIGKKYYIDVQKYDYSDLM
ncbi:MAG: AsnC family protein [Sulfurimonas sp.]|uniref:AsnC family protein n=1 Tax=Sulfurimonas sp. TaxID=2022749 RepID=UPI00261D0D9D|nr:AsnC family protein [Sulfurimonas sp.]MDD5400541.1 AsnC family protein [Sulfurimonas sp.]